MSKKVGKLGYIIVATVLIILVGFMGYRLETVIAKKKNLVQSVPTQTVQVKEIGMEKKENYLELYGSIDAVNKVGVSSKIGGRVSKVLVDNGDTVNSGQSLVVLDDQDYRNLLSTSQDTLNKAELRLNDTKADYDRYQKLFSAGAIAQRDLDKAKLAVDAAQADVNSAQTGVSNAEQTLENAVITAPFAGVLASRSVSEGQMVSPGLPLFLVADISSVYAVVNVKQDDLDKVKLGQSVQVIVDEDNQHPLTGKVSLVNPVANQAARVFEVRIKVENKDSRLKPGMFVKTRITTGNPANVLTVPQEAMSGKEGAYYVFVAEGNQARQKPVEIGSVWGGQIEVRSGLKPGDKVIVTNVNKLKNEDQIAIAGQQGDK